MPDPRQVSKVVRQWWAKAEKDFYAASYLLADRTGGDFHEIVAFHAQQAVEKYLKSVLVHHQIPFPKTHDTADLLDRLEGAERNLRRNLPDLSRLRPFGAEIRYPGEIPPVTGKQAGETVSWAESVRNAVRNALGKASPLSGAPGQRLRKPSR